MNLNEDAKEAVKNLSDAINSAVESSVNVGEAIEVLRQIGYEPCVSLKFEVILQKNVNNFEDGFEDLELDLTEDDVRALRRMKIRF